MCGFLVLLQQSLVHYTQLGLLKKAVGPWRNNHNAVDKVHTSRSTQWHLSVHPEELCTESLQQESRLTRC